jgi:tRNA(fMet)-specific endonuclease VapC
VTHLDTSFVIDLLRERARGGGGAATAWLEAHPDEPLAVSVFVACELEAGAARAIHASREQHRVRALLDAVTVVYPDDRFAPRFGATLAAILRTGRSMATMDLLIATSALLEGAPLATANRRHFEVVPDLVVIGYRAHVRDT